ncbi:hypothetical protein HELRODRAFT_167905 [Helobdella robusta]|uniref:Uncharacterized protein n=1 Tax=Helobdella robusta TaxID=6412 RepID=T1EZX9_HELRO|nr:hypothetical protein HELRODRAFT_167905 [Helobdella robusta]ESO10059.1 hypothetical protein HELRODRAFT_167905 [Helobdella robusta]
MSAGVAKVIQHPTLNKNRKSCFEITNVAFQSHSDDESGDDNVSSSYTDFEEDKDSNGFNCSMIVPGKNKNDHHMISSASTNDVQTKCKSRFKIFKFKAARGRWKCFDFADNDSFHASYSVANLSEGLFENTTEWINTNGSSKSSASNININKTILSTSLNCQQVSCTPPLQSQNLNEAKIITVAPIETRKDLVDHSNSGLNFPNPSYKLLHPILNDDTHLPYNSFSLNCSSVQVLNNAIQVQINDITLQNNVIQNENILGTSLVNNVVIPNDSFTLPVINSECQMVNVVNPSIIDMPSTSSDILNDCINQNIEYLNPLLCSNASNELNNPHYIDYATPLICSDISNDRNNQNVNQNELLVDVETPVQCEISEKISQALDLAKEHLIITTNETVENLRLEITNLLSTIHLLQEENRQLRCSSNQVQQQPESQQTLPTSPVSVLTDEHVPVGDLIDLSDL